MTELDLSLLTDEELANSFQTVSIQAHGAKNDKYVAKFHAIRNELLGRLIAARAENKRLLDEGRSLHDRLVTSTEENKRKDEALVKARKP